MATQRGNILFLILLAVVLFAALSYAVTSSTRGGGKDASPEKYKTMAAQLVQFGTLVEQSIIRARTVGGAPEWGLDLDDGSGPSTSNNNNTCTDPGCLIFTKPGRTGLMTSVKFGEEYVDPAFRANNPSYGGGSGTEMSFRMIPVAGMGTALPDLLYTIQGLTPALCQAVNESLWGRAYSEEEGYGGGIQAYSGTLTGPLTSTAPNLWDGFYTGKNTACIGRLGSGYGGDFYYVVMPR